MIIDNKLVHDKIWLDLELPINDIIYDVLLTKFDSKSHVHFINRHNKWKWPYAKSCWWHKYAIVLNCTMLQWYNSNREVFHLGRAKRIWYLSPMRAAKVQASLRIRAVSPEPSLLAHTSSESRGTFRRKARSLAPLNGWACAVKVCHDGMLEDTNSLDSAHLTLLRTLLILLWHFHVYLKQNSRVESFIIYNSCIWRTQSIK